VGEPRVRDEKKWRNSEGIGMRSKNEGKESTQLQRGVENQISLSEGSPALTRGVHAIFYGVNFCYKAVALL